MHWPMRPIRRPDDEVLTSRFVVKFGHVSRSQVSVFRGIVRLAAGFLGADVVRPLIPLMPRVLLSSLFGGLDPRCAKTSSAPMPARNAAPFSSVRRVTA
jgi:hypothetical protein